MQEGRACAPRADYSGVGSSAMSLRSFVVIRSRTSGLDAASGQVTRYSSKSRLPPASSHVAM